VSNAFTLADDYLIEANIAGTAAAAAWIELRLLVSEDSASSGVPVNDHVDVRAR